MQITDGRNETLGNTAEPVPRQTVSLASAHQRVSPSATNWGRLVFSAITGGRPGLDRQTHGRLISFVFDKQTEN